MFKILCPIDFSKNSLFAIEYAINFANKLNSAVTFMTSYSLPMPENGLRIVNLQIEQKLKSDLLNFTKELINTYKTDYEPSYIVIEGDVSNVITHYSEKNMFDLVIMGTMGSSGIGHMTMGSITKRVIENARVPILAVPHSFWENLSGNDIVLCLDNYGISSLPSISLIKKIKENLQIDLKVLHFIQSKEEKIELHNNTGLLFDIVDDIVELKGSNNITKDIKEYANQHSIGIIAMVAKKHSYFEKIFFEMNTTGELFVTNVPLLILPE